MCKENTELFLWPTLMNLLVENGAEYTTIDGSRNGSVITVISYVIALDTTNSIEGFTITNGGYIRNNSTTIYNRYGSVYSRRYRYIKY